MSLEAKNDNLTLNENEMNQQQNLMMRPAPLKSTQNQLFDNISFARFRHIVYPSYAKKKAPLRQMKT
jgi:hypothetical protein